MVVYKYLLILNFQSSYFWIYFDTILQYLYIDKVFFHLCSICSFLYSMHDFFKGIVMGSSTTTIHIT